METPDSTSTGSDLAALRRAIDDLDAWVEDYHKRSRDIVPCAGDLGTWVQADQETNSSSPPRPCKPTQGRRRPSRSRELTDLEEYVVRHRNLGEKPIDIARELGYLAPRISQADRRGRAKLRAQGKAQLADSAASRIGRQARAMAQEEEAVAQLAKRRACMRAEGSRVEIEWYLQEAYLWLCRSYGRDVWRDDRDI